MREEIVIKVIQKNNFPFFYSPHHKKNVFFLAFAFIYTFLPLSYSQLNRIYRRHTTTCRSGPGLLISRSRRSLELYTREGTSRKAQRGGKSMRKNMKKKRRKRMKQGFHIFRRAPAIVSPHFMIFFLCVHVSMRVCV